MKKRISISTAFDYGIPIEKQIQLIAHAGFSHISIGEKEQHSNYKNIEARTLIKDLLCRYSLEIDTIHGPRLDKPNVLEEITSVSEAANDLNIPIIVLHGSPFTFAEHELEERLNKLLVLCKQLDFLSEKYNVTFALENVMPGPATELIRRAILITDSNNLGFCYDSSHDQIGGPNPFNLLDDLKDYLIAVHISDRVKDFVDHVIPWEGFINWEILIAKIKKTKFAAPLLLEVMVMNSDTKESLSFLRLSYERGCKLYNMLYT